MTLNPPLVSVLLVTYNQEAFIRRAIEGVLIQVTAFPVELVIGEDASIDNTRQICEEYAAKFPQKIRLLSGRENLGLNLNFLRTFALCKGKYIAYLEGDDWWIANDKLQKQVDVLEGADDVVLAHTNFKLFDLESKKYQDRLIRYEGQCIRELQAGLSGVLAEFRGTFRPMKTSTVCYRRDVMQTILDEDQFLFSNPEFPTQDFQLFQEMSLEEDLHLLTRIPLLFCCMIQFRPLGMSRKKPNSDWDSSRLAFIWSINIGSVPKIPRIGFASSCTSFFSMPSAEETGAFLGLW